MEISGTTTRPRFKPFNIKLTWPPLIGEILSRVVFYSFIPFTSISKSGIFLCRGGSMDQYIEFQNWGWNVTTYSFIGTIILGFVFGWGLFKQIETIRLRRSGKSIPITMNVFFAFHFFAFSMYGVRVHSFAILMNGIFGILYLKIYLDAARWPDSEGKTRLQYLFALMPLSMLLVPNPSIQLSLQFVGTTFFLFQSPLEIYVKRDAGSVEPKMIVCFIASATFWTVFSACISEWPLFVVNIIGIIVMCITLGLWVKFRRNSIFIKMF